MDPMRRKDFGSWLEIVDLKIHTALRSGRKWRKSWDNTPMVLDDHLRRLKHWLGHGRMMINAEL
jgi:hypothetical protein